MPSWNDLLNEMNQQEVNARNAWLLDKYNSYLNDISRLRSGRNIIVYSSAFLQKPQISPFYLQITHEEINGFMSVMHGMNWADDLTLILHTPGGVTNATETIVEYLRSKFDFIEVIIPTYAMSAGTMISLASDQIIMGRPSQLGPIDPQMQLGGRLVSARAIVDQFERAKQDISQDSTHAHLWAPILQSLGPALLQEAQNSLNYSERMVKKWLEKWMFKDKPNPKNLAKKAASYFNKGNLHLSHGRRIDRSEARSRNINILDLEEEQPLQEAVLTAYHLFTIMFESSPTTKFISSNHGKAWVKNYSNT